MITSDKHHEVCGYLGCRPTDMKLLGGCHNQILSCNYRNMLYWREIMVE